MGVLFRAKQEGRVAAVRPLMDELRRHGIWLGQRVYQFAIREAGES